MNILDYKTKQSDGVTRVPEYWKIWTTPSLALLPGPLRPVVESPDKVLPMGEIEVINV